MTCREFFEGYLKSENKSISKYMNDEGVNRITYNKFLSILEDRANKGNPIAIKILRDYIVKMDTYQKERKRERQIEKSSILAYKHQMKDRVYEAIVYELLDCIKQGNEDGTPFTLLDFAVSEYGEKFNINTLCTTSARCLSKEDHMLFISVFGSGRFNESNMPYDFNNGDLSLHLDGEVHQITEEEKASILEKMDELELPKSLTYYKLMFERMYSNKSNLLSANK